MYRILLVLLIAMPATSLAAQTAAEHNAVDSTLRYIDASRESEAVDVDRMHAAEALFIEAVTRHEKWARAWYGLGIARLELVKPDVLAREGPLLPIGMNNEYGGEQALMRAIELDHTLAAAGDALALASTWHEGTSQMHDRALGTRPAYSVMSGPGLAAAAYAEREGGSVDSAIMLEERALKVGGIDSSVVMTSLARDLYRVGASSDGRKILFAAAATKSRVGQENYRSELAWVASPSELAAWDALAPAERPGWVANFWTRRDIADGRRDGARLEEHYRRIEYAMKNFRLRLPRSGKQQMVSMTPSSADGYMNEVNARHMITLNGDKYPEAARMLQQGKMIGSESSSRYFHSIQSQINDKGVIWIRHGEPTKVAHNSTGQPFEVWRYDRPEGPLVLYFRQVDFEGSSMPNELVPTILDASPVIRNQVCSVDTTLCSTSSTRTDFNHLPFGSDPSNPRSLADEIEREVHLAGASLAPEAILRAANAGKAAIDLATTTDTYHRDFTHAVHPLVEIYGVDRAAGGAPRMLIAFAIPGAELIHKTVGDRIVYPVQIQVMSANAQTGARLDLDTLRQFASVTALAPGQFITGILELPIPPGRYSASVSFSQEDGRGAIASLSEIVIPSATAPLTVSDLILGNEGSGVVWNSGATPVPLNPLNTYRIGGNTEVYFQLSGLIAGSSYQLRFELFKDGDQPAKGARLTIAADQKASAARMEISRKLGLANLDAGRYRLRLTVTGEGKSATASGWITITK